VSLQPPRSRLRAALLVTALALSGLGYLAGHAGAPGAASHAAGAATTTTTPAPPARGFAFPLRGRVQQLIPQAERRALGWHASDGPVSLTLASIARSSDPNDTSGDATAALTVRVDGLPAGERLLGLQGLVLLDAGGGVYATPRVVDIGRQRGVPAFAGQSGAPPGSYLVELGPAPSVATLAKVQVQALIVSRPPATSVPLDSVPPSATHSATLQALPQGDRDAVDVPLELSPAFGRDSAAVELSAAFVSAHRAVLIAAVDYSGSGAFADQEAVVPFTIALVADGREICSRTDMLSGSHPANPSVTLDCPADFTAAARLGAVFGSATAMVAFPRTITR
jgi:hypothetical protein